MTNTSEPNMTVVDQQLQNASQKISHIHDIRETPITGTIVDELIDVVQSLHLIVQELAKKTPKDQQG